MSISSAIAVCSNGVSSSVLNERDGFSDEELANLTRIRDEFLKGNKSTHKGNGPWKTVAELMRTAFAPDHLVPIPEKSGRIIHKNRNKNTEDSLGENVLIHRIVRRADGLRIALKDYKKGKNHLLTDDCLQYCINWLIGVKPCREEYWSGVRYSKKPNVIIGKIASSFYAKIRQMSDVPLSERLTIPSYATVDFFVYEFLKPVIEQTALFSTGKRKREAEPFDPNKRTKLEESEPSSSSSSSSSLEIEPSEPSSNNGLNSRLLLPPMGSMSSSSPGAPYRSFNSSSST